VNVHEASPNRIPWPPLILVASVAASLVLNAVVPVGLGGHAVVRLCGLLILACGLLLDLLAMATMGRARTNILPHRPADRLLTHGVFAWSRNPIYLGNVLLLIGGGLVSDIAWFLPAAVAAMALTDRLAVRREEAHLAAKFGNAYRQYARTTRRWFGRVRPS
jgi:protein-S-isoprenylcysteine O-methyltransferase Ste14